MLLMTSQVFKLQDETDDLKVPSLSMTYLKFQIENSVAKELKIVLGYILHSSHHHAPLRKGKHPSFV